MITHDAGNGLSVTTARAWLAISALLLCTWALQGHAQAACDAASFGLNANAADNSAALTKVLAACAGKKIQLAPGTYWFRPSGYVQGFMVANGTVLEGAGADTATPTVFRVADEGTFASMLWVRNASHVAIRGIRFEGSHFDSGCGRGLDYGHAIYLQSDTAVPAGVEDVVIAGNVFKNFNGLSWVTLNAREGSPGIGVNSLITIDKNSFLSDAGLVGGCGNLGIGYSVAMISIHGANESAQGMIENVSVSANRFEAAYVKQAVAIWSDTARINVQYNTIRAVGRGLPPASGELGRYAILIYDSAYANPGLHPSDVHVVGNTIEDPVSCGVYVVVAHNLEISGNRISGQRDPHDVTLPKGGIVMNHADESVVSGNDLRNNHIGIAAVAGSVRIENNTIVPPADGIRMKIWRGDKTPPEIQR
jgi:Right handed beta helix region